jgi:hypothetical protein
VLGGQKKTLANVLAGMGLGGDQAQRSH